jgi:hypothetical protein
MAGPKKVIYPPGVTPQPGTTAQTQTTKPPGAASKPPVQTPQHAGGTPIPYNPPTVKGVFMTNKQRRLNAAGTPVKVPPGLAKKPGQMPPGQVKKAARPAAVRPDPVKVPARPARPGNLPAGKPDMRRRRVVKV